jgi:ketosteroid isomerase-like protein
MQQSADVRDGLLRFYDRFSSGDAAGFAEAIAQAEGVSVIGTGPGEGHDDRDDWISTYGQMMRAEMAGTRLEAGDPRTYEEGAVGWGVDQPQFVFPDGSRLPTRVTAVLHKEDGDWKILHLHFSVGVPDEQAMELSAQSTS